MCYWLCMSGKLQRCSEPVWNAKFHIWISKYEPLREIARGEGVRGKASESLNTPHDTSPGREKQVERASDIWMPILLTSVLCCCKLTPQGCSMINTFSWSRLGWYKPLVREFHSVSLTRSGPVIIHAHVSVQFLQLQNVPYTVICISYSVCVKNFKVKHYWHK